MLKKKITVFGIVQLACLGLFLGRAYQHLFWDAPFRSVLWDKMWMEDLVFYFWNLNWEDYITDPQVDLLIGRVVQSFGIFYLVAALACLFVKSRFGGLARSILLIASFSLLLLAFFYAKEKFYSPVQFFEYTLQWSSPLFLISLSKRPFDYDRILIWLKLATALSFTAHGLYAMNVVPRPVHFMEMTMNILGVGNEAAGSFLITVGILDLILSIGLFLPRQRIVFTLACYAVFWGFSTSAARVLAHCEWAYIWAGLHQWLFESVLRFPHFLIPLAIVWILKLSKADST